MLSLKRYDKKYIFYMINGRYWHMKNVITHEYLHAITKNR